MAGYGKQWAGEGDGGGGLRRGSGRRYTFFGGGRRAPLAALNGRASTLEKGTSKDFSESFCVCRLGAGSKINISGGLQLCEGEGLLESYVRIHVARAPEMKFRAIGR